MSLPRGRNLDKFQLRLRQIIPLVRQWSSAAAAAASVDKVKRCYKTLNVSEDCSDEEIKVHVDPFRVLHLVLQHLIDLFRVLDFHCQ